MVLVEKFVLDQIQKQESFHPLHGCAQQQQTAATSLIAKLLTQTTNVQRRKTIQEITDVQIETPLLVEGELSIGVDEQLNYNNFMNKMQDN